MSGVHVSILPALTPNKQSKECKLYGANDTEIKTNGMKLLSLDLWLRGEFQFSFIVAKIDKGVLVSKFITD